MSWQNDKAKIESVINSQIEKKGQEVWGRGDKGIKAVMAFKEKMEI